MIILLRGGVYSIYHTSNSGVQYLVKSTVFQSQVGDRIYIFPSTGDNGSGAYPFISIIEMPQNISITNTTNQLTNYNNSITSAIDQEFASLTNGDVITYDSTTQKWKNSSISQFTNYLVKNQIVASNTGYTNSTANGSGNNVFALFDTTNTNFQFLNSGSWVINSTTEIQYVGTSSTKFDFNMQGLNTSASGNHMVLIIYNGTTYTRYYSENGYLGNGNVQPYSWSHITINTNDKIYFGFSANYQSFNNMCFQITEVQRYINQPIMYTTPSLTNLSYTRWYKQGLTEGSNINSSLYLLLSGSSPAFLQDSLSTIADYTMNSDSITIN